MCFPSKSHFSLVSVNIAQYLVVVTMRQGKSCFSKFEWCSRKVLFCEEALVIILSPVNEDGVSI